MSQAKRGYIPGDERDFSGKSLEKLRLAARHITYLINEGYPVKSASTFAGNHFLLSERQRLALVRSISTREQLVVRSEKELGAAGLEGKTVFIDGFNTIITLEVALSHSPLFLCMDGTIRDLAGLRGTYRPIGVTSEAIGRIAQILASLRVKEAVFYLDAPVSNSGRLKSLIAEVFEAYETGLELSLLPDVDRTLMEKDCVVTADAMILDTCKSWFNLVKLCLDDLSTDLIQVW